MEDARLWWGRAQGAGGIHDDSSHSCLLGILFCSSYASDMLNGAVHTRDAKTDRVERRTQLWTGRYHDEQTKTGARTGFLIKRSGGNNSLSYF